MEIMDSIAFVDRSVRASVGRYAQPQHGERLGHALAQARRRAGMGRVQLGGQRGQLGLGGQRGLGVVGPPHPGRDDRA